MGISPFPTRRHPTVSVESSRVFFAADTPEGWGQIETLCTKHNKISSNPFRSITSSYISSLYFTIVMHRLSLFYTFTSSYFFGYASSGLLFLSKNFLFSLLSIFLLSGHNLGAGCFISTMVFFRESIFIGVRQKSKEICQDKCSVISKKFRTITCRQN